MYTTHVCGVNIQAEVQSRDRRERWPPTSLPTRPASHPWAPANPAPFVAHGERCGGGDSVPGLTDPQARTPCRDLYVLAPGRTTCCVAELTPILLSTIPLARLVWI